jgi:hypothetical protein
MSWKRHFEDPIPLPRGRQLVILQDAADYIVKLSKADRELPEWQAAGEALIGPARFCRSCSRSVLHMMDRPSSLVLVSCFRRWHFSALAGRAFN